MQKCGVITKVIKAVTPLTVAVTAQFQKKYSIVINGAHNWRCQRHVEQRTYSATLRSYSEYARQNTNGTLASGTNLQ
jgi:hypothetical protein